LLGRDFVTDGVFIPFEQVEDLFAYLVAEWFVVPFYNELLESIKSPI